MSGDHLPTLFRCERFLGLFPTGMPVRACLRRQLERQVAKDGKGARLPFKEWLPAKAFCAGECQLGRENANAAEAAGVMAATCRGCGAALVGEGALPECSACAEDESQVPRGALPPRAEPSARLWTGEVPDVAIRGPARSDDSPLLPRQHHAPAPAHRAPVHPEEPAEPAEEETMSKTVCGSCGSPSKHRGTCKGGPRVPAKEAKEPEPPAKPKRTAVPRLVEARTARRAKATPKGDFDYLASESADDLVASVAKLKATLAAVRAELLRRKGVIDEALAEVGEEVAA